MFDFYLRNVKSEIMKKQLREMMNEYENDVKAMEEINDCEHYYIEMDEGIKSCKKCGSVSPVITFVSCFEDAKRTRQPRKPYDRMKHLNQLLLKLNGAKFGDCKEKDPEIPDNMEIKDVRIWMKKNKLNAKNDFYYWRLSNKIEQMIRSNDRYDWATEYKRLRTNKAKDFVFDKVNKNENYKVFSILLHRKAPKKEKETKQIE
jgi:hypothetical protein